ncbi:MAG: hypothetical protein IIA72_00390 [Proteobacteria bacterium]|nr:hypothetical protein [Pseudomonadota bacterium]
MLPKVVVTNRVHDEVLGFLRRRATLDGERPGGALNEPAATEGRHPG